MLSVNYPVPGVHKLFPVRPSSCNFLLQFFLQVLFGIAAPKWKWAVLHVVTMNVYQLVNGERTQFRSEQLLPKVIGIFTCLVRLFQVKFCISPFHGKNSVRERNFHPQVEQALFASECQFPNKIRIWTLGKISLM